MKKDYVSIAAGGVVLKEGAVLLVQMKYGNNRGNWIIPGGFLEPGETLQEAVVREVLEESGIHAEPKRLVGLRSGVKLHPNRQESNVYAVFEMAFLSGEAQGDDDEVLDAKFWLIADALSSETVLPLSREMIRSALQPGGLTETEALIHTKTKYKTYQCYLID